MLRTVIRTKYTSLPEPIVTRKKWGPRKNFSKEVPLPINKTERPVIWNAGDREIKWNNKTKQMEAYSHKKSPLLEKFDTVMGRLRRANPIGGYRNKQIIEDKYTEALKARLSHQNHVNDGVNPAFFTELQEQTEGKVGMLLWSANNLCHRMNCSVLYEAQTVDAEGECEWIHNFVGNTMLVDPLELKLIAIDGRFSELGFKGMINLRGHKHIRYLNVQDAPFFNDHCMSRLHYIDNSLEYLDLSGTDVTIYGLSYLRLLRNLKWLNLANMLKQHDMENYAAFIAEVVPPNCQVIYNETTENDKDLLPAGGSEVGQQRLSKEDVQEMFNMPPLGHTVSETKFSAKLRRNRMQNTYNNVANTRKINRAIYAKAAERLPPLV